MTTIPYKKFEAVPIAIFNLDIEQAVRSYVDDLAKLKLLTILAKSDSAAGFTMT